jgi:DNA-binding transcriptional LysR family regulator
MELQQLRTFQVVARTLSFTQAAALLNYAQSSITAQIRALEKELGKPLFNRLGRKVQLTDAGKQMLWYADKLLKLAEEAQSVVSNDRRLAGAISIGAPETICTYHLPGILRTFRAKFPQVQLSYRPMLDADIYQQVRNGTIDVAFLLQEPLQSNGLIVERLRQESLLVLSAAGHPLSRLPHVGPADLKGETVLLTENGCGYRHLFERALVREGTYPQSTLEFNSVEAIKQCVIAGLGIAFLPQVAVAEEITRGTLAVLNWKEPFHAHTLMVWHKDTWLSLPLNEFLNLSRAMLCENR